VASSLSLNGMFHRKRLWVVRFFWNSSHLLRVRHGLRLAPRGRVIPFPAAAFADCRF
jgi:hypothetical protein